MPINSKKICVGSIETNCYLLWDEECSVIIDPGAEPERLMAEIEKPRPLKAILLTHGHFDHIGAVAALKEKTGAKAYIHRDDAEMITDPNKSLSFMTGETPPVFEPDVFVRDGGELSFGTMKFSVMHTPGHSPGGVCYSIGGSVFCGDLIFYRSVGRFDYGSFSDEMASVKRVLSSFPDEFLLLPGHGPATNIGDERKYNPYANEVQP